MIPESNFYVFFETIAEMEAPEICFHIRLSDEIECDDFGAMGLAWKAAPTLRRSFSRMDHYVRCFNNTSSFSLEDRGASVWWIHHRNEPNRLGLHLSNEGTFSTQVALCREAASPDFTPEYVLFRHQALGSKQAVEDHFRCPVHFGSDVNALIIPSDIIDQPNRVGDESIWQFLSSQLEETLSETNGTQSLDRNVVERVAEVLSDGPPGITDIAADLAMSPRTLQRRLADAGCTFQDLVEKARHELSTNLLADTHYSLAEVAFLTGFSEQSAFSRAFKRWSGMTPGSYRAHRVNG
jgi:AraC-like DNA-binding protein